MSSRNSITSLLLFLFMILPLSVPAQLQFPQNRPLLQGEVDRLFLQVLSVFPEEKIPVEYRARIADQHVAAGCATMLLANLRASFDRFTLEQKAILSRLLDRPDLPLQFISSDGRFKIHYTLSGDDAVSADDFDNSGIPDFVEETAAAFVKSYEIQVDSLGYRTPPLDVGNDGRAIDGPEYDVYIQNLNTLYGFTLGENGVPATSREDLSSYISVDNDFENGHFTSGVDGARVTAAHEYFHAIQFGYRTLMTSDEQFYYEVCSVWMEEVVFDSINDYYQYLPTFFRLTQIPFNQFDPFLRAFGSGIWNIFLVKRFGDDADLVRRTWEIMAPGVLAIQALDASLQEQGSSFTQEFAEFAIWNYFTGSRADNANFYPESDAYPEISIDADEDMGEEISFSDSSKALTHRYYRVTTTVAGEYAVSGTVEQPGNWTFVAITITPDGVEVFTFFHPITGLNLGFLPAATQIVVIPVNLKILDGPDLPLLDTSWLTFEFKIEAGNVPVTEGRGIREMFPNPLVLGLHEAVNVIVSPDSESGSVMRIFSADGRIVRSTRLSPTAAVFSWDGKDDSGELVPSGVYVIQFEQDGFFDVVKLAVIRR